MKTIVLIDFYNEAKIKKDNVIVVKPRGFTKETDTAEVRQYIIDWTIHHLLENGVITEDDYMVMVY